MRTTIDIADDQYAALKGLAAQERTSVRALIAEMIAIHLLPRMKKEATKSFKIPVLRSRGEELDLDHDRIADLLAEEPSE